MGKFNLQEDNILNYREIYNSISKATNNFNKQTGDFKYKARGEADLAKGILGEKYHNVYIKPLNMNKEYDLFYSVVYSKPKNIDDKDMEKQGNNNYMDLEFQDNKNPAGTPLGNGTGFGESLIDDSSIDTESIKIEIKKQLTDALKKKYKNIFVDFDDEYDDGTLFSVHVIVYDK